MPSFDIIKKNTPNKSFRVQSIIGSYDLQQESVVEHFSGTIDLPNHWNVGLIVGRSGSGKTTIAKELFNADIINGFEWHNDNILDDMPKEVSVKEIAETLTAVGFSSPISWLKPYSVLSNGEKMRCDIARALLESKNMIVFDEFTSVVDRNVAQISSLAIQKSIRNKNKQFIAVTCHYDVQDWLMPDWVFNTDNMTFQLLDVETQKKNKPKLNIEIFDTKRKEYFWNFFKKYHYLSHNFNKAAQTIIATCNGALCGFIGILPFPHPIKKNTWKIHRVVVFPDFQGVGIGNAITNMVAELYAQEGKNLIITTSNPAMIHALVKNKKWAMTRKGRASSGSGSGKIQNKYKKNSTSCNRITASFEYSVK